jgi:hypothetical protein
MLQKNKIINLAIVSRMKIIITKKGLELVILQRRRTDLRTEGNCYRS